jgi:hypothetical protein
MYRLYVNDKNEIIDFGKQEDYNKTVDFDDDRPKATAANNVYAACRALGLEINS